MKLTPKQNIAVDTVPLTFNKETKKLLIYMPKREFEPYLGERSLPGVLLEEFEYISHAINRLFETKIPIKYSSYHIITLSPQIDPYRDDRGHVISIPSIVFLSGVEDYTDWIEYSTESILDFENTKIKTFDHASILLKAHLYLKDNKRELYNLLDNEFTLNQLKELWSYFNEEYKTKRDSNFKKEISKEIEVTGVTNIERGRPVKVYKRS